MSLYRRGRPRTFSQPSFLPTRYCKAVRERAALLSSPPVRGRTSPRAPPAGFGRCSVGLARVPGRLGGSGVLIHVCAREQQLRKRRRRRFAFCTASCTVEIRSPALVTIKADDRVRTAVGAPPDRCHCRRTRSAPARRVSRMVSPVCGECCGQPLARSHAPGGWC